MDQFVSACGKQGHALLIDCRAPYATEHVPLNDPDLTLLVANSNVKHALSGSEYPDRVRQCQEACTAMRAAGHSKVAFLRDATLEQLRSVKGLDPGTLPQGASNPGPGSSLPQGASNPGPGRAPSPLSPV